MDADDASGRECAICLAIPDVLDVARVDACLHAFHARCLARWATFTSPGTKTRCPVCKVPFAHALTRRGLDGTPRASFREEPMCLLVRARWCGDDADGAEEDPGEESESDVDADDADADAADAAEALAMRRRGRLVIGNRRFGRGGFVSGGGRRFARPIVGREGKGARREEAPKTPKTPATARASREERTAGSPSDEKDASVSAPRTKGPKSAKRAESKARKAEKEAAKAAARLKRREEEAAAAARKEAARKEAEAARVAMESLRVDSELTS